MPFIEQWRRKVIESTGIDTLVEYPPYSIQPGDRCYVQYKAMVDKWRANPRWTTAHEIYSDVLAGFSGGFQEMVAKQLAWQVFFQLHVLKYEKQKREENGDI